jgi:hypothetical protein
MKQRIHRTNPIPDVIEFTPDGNGAGLYTEVIDLARIGRLDITRATRVEFDVPSQRWQVFDFTGHQLFAHRSRRVCLDWERRHFNEPIHTQSLNRNPNPM